MQIETIYGNIVKQPDADAIVNSANANLRMGSGVAVTMNGAVRFTAKLDTTGGWTVQPSGSAYWTSRFVPAPKAGLLSLTAQA